jgi:hypothetical protein
MSSVVLQDLNPRSRPRVFNKPFSDLDLRSAEGRRVWGVAIQLLQWSGMSINDPLVVADAIAAAQLRIRAERARRDSSTSIDELTAITKAADDACKQFTPVELRLT